MTPSQAALVESLRARFGAKIAVTDQNDIAPWLSDWRGRYHGAAPALLAPATTEEVAAIVTAARDAGIALVPQGGNTSMVGGATPPADGSALILSTRRMNRVRGIDIDANLAVAEAGVILTDFHDATEAAGRRFPLSLGSKGSATIGGLSSTNAGGTQVLRWGTMRGLIAGVEAVLPDGSIHDGLAALKKDNRGYDLNQLLIGAEGTLGVITAVTLRLAPAIAARGVAWVGLPTPHAALALLRMIEAQSDAVESFEIIPGEIVDLVVRHIPDSRAPLGGNHGWHVLIEAVASDLDREAPTALLERLLAKAFEDGLIEDATLAASEAQAEAFWRIRHSISEAERAAGPQTQHDISVPVARMPDFLIDDARAIETAFPGTRATGFGHLGDGNVHFHVHAPAGSDRDTWFAEQAPLVMRLVHDHVVAAGGSISAEHGIGQMKLAELERLGPPSRLTALRAIKGAFDPHGLFNPGKLVRLVGAPGAP